MTPVASRALRAGPLTITAKDASTMPKPPAQPPPDRRGPEPPGQPSVTSLLFSHGLDAPRESRRIVLGFALLVAVGLVGLNVGLWHAAGQRMEREAWMRLEAAADVRRAEVDHVLGVLRREATSIARDPSIASEVIASGGGSLDHGTSRLLDQLHRRAQAFEFDNVTVLDRRGTVLSSQLPRTASRDIAYRRAGARCNSRSLGRCSGPMTPVNSRAPSAGSLTDGQGRLDDAEAARATPPGPERA